MNTQTEATISLDFDGVITDPHALKAAELCRMGFEVAPAQSQRRYAIERLGVPLDVYEEAARRANAVRIAEVPLAVGAPGAIRALSDLGLRIVVVTARSLEQCESVHEFVARHRLPIAEVRSSYGSSKAASLNGMFPLFHVDDTSLHLEQIRRSLPEIELLLFRNVANEWWLQENPCAFTVVDWPDVVHCAMRLLSPAMRAFAAGKGAECRVF